MSEYQYKPHKKIPLQSKAIKITRKMLSILASLDREHKFDAEECMEVINDQILEFQYYLGETCGDKATRWFGFPVSQWLLEAHNDENAHDKLDDALIMGNKKILEEDCGLFKWLNNLIAYGESCYGDSQYLPSTFDPSKIDLVHDLRLLMEQHLGMVARPTDEGWVYEVDDSRGEEYGKWWFAISCTSETKYTQGKPIKEADGSYRKDEYGKILYSEYTQYEQVEETIEVTKFFGEDDKYFRLSIPFGEFQTFFNEMVK